MTGVELAAAAEDLVGTRFRLHGRNPETGLDCIGLLSAAMERAGGRCPVPIGYSLRLRDLSHWLPDPIQFGFAEASAPFQPGDIVLLCREPVQFHLAIAGIHCWVHAHASLRRVVRQSDLPNGTLVHHWRLIPPN